MKIGIDIDDVITDSSRLFKEYFEKYGSRYFEPDEMKENLIYIMRGNFVNDKIKKFILTYIKEIISNVKLKPNAVEVLTRLRESGDEIFLITTRGIKVFEGAEELTIKYLKDHNVPYDNIIFNAYNKDKEIKENNIELMVDDSVEICENLNLKGIKSYLFTTDVNKNQNTSVKRVFDWLDLEKKIIDEK